MNNQPLFNIGCLGSVSDGKSTLVEKLTTIKTQKHSSEKYSKKGFMLISKFLN